ncbi:MAG: hypothetical protein B7Z73_03390, partial [Planctomycetia bacterium 21-64-5]
MGTTGAISFTGNSTLQWSAANTEDVSSRLVIDNGVDATLDVGTNDVTLASGFGGGGTGALTKAGSGTLTLAGNNTYTGGTTINDGVLAFASGALGTSGTIAFAGNSTLRWSGANTQDISSRLVIDNGVDATLDVGTNDVTLASGFGGNGTGALTKVGSGTLTLTGNNTYSGGTTITAGTLAFASGALGTTGTISFIGNAALRWYGYNTQDISGRLMLSDGLNATLDVGTNSVTLATAIGGGSSASLTKAGTGTLLFTGNNTYTGGTTIGAGTLQVGGNTTAGTVGSGAVVDNGSLVFDLSGSATIANAISGSGMVAQSSSGTLILTGNNSYAGTTTINAGTLQIGAGGTTGSLGTGSVAGSYTTLAFDRSDNVNVANALGGTIGVVQQGTGTLTLTGSNTYAGTTTVNAGTLQIGAGGTTGSLGTGSVTGSALLAFDRNDNVTVANALGGTMSVVQEGTGTLTLTGSNTYTGTTTINAGSTLQV